MPVVKQSDSGGGGGGYSPVCAARFWKTIPYFRPKYVIFPTVDPISFD